MSAAAGRYADLALIPLDRMPSADLDQQVWAVTFEGDFVICPPTEPPPCWTPRPGTRRVFLDYATGEFLSSEGVSYH